MIDPKAVVSKDARLGEGVRIDAYAIVEPNVEIGESSWVGNHAVIRSGTRIGKANLIHDHVSLGGAPQSIHYQDEPTELHLGDNNVVREFASFHRGLVDYGGVTRIGSDNFFMAYVHIAHDCKIGDHSTFTNGTSLAGHVEVGDHAVLGGFTMIHQRCRVGSYCMTGINTVARQDIPPYVMVAGNPAKAVAINSIGLRRNEFDETAIDNLKCAYQAIFRMRVPISGVRQGPLANIGKCAHTEHMLDFLNSSKRGFVR